MICIRFTHDLTHNLFEIYRCRPVTCVQATQQLPRKYEYFTCTTIYEYCSWAITLLYTGENLAFLSRVTDEKIYEIYWHGFMKEATETSLRHRPHAAIFWGRVRHDLWPIRLSWFSVHFPKLLQHPVISFEQIPQLRNASEKLRVKLLGTMPSTKMRTGFSSVGSGAHSGARKDETEGIRSKTRTQLFIFITRLSLSILFFIICIVLLLST